MLGLVGINSMIKKTISYLQVFNFSVFGTTHGNLAPVRSQLGYSDHV